MEALPGLGTMRVFVRSRAAVIESVGVFGGFSETGPFFNVQTDTLDMHILHDEIGRNLRRREARARQRQRDALVPVLRPTRRRRLQGVPLGGFSERPRGPDRILPLVGSRTGRALILSA